MDCEERLKKIEDSIDELTESIHGTGKDVGLVGEVRLMKESMCSLEKILTNDFAHLKIDVDKALNQRISFSWIAKDVFIPIILTMITAFLLIKFGLH